MTTVAEALLESDVRNRRLIELLKEVEHLASLSGVNENEDDSWGEWIRKTRSALGIQGNTPARYDRLTALRNALDWAFVIVMEHSNAIEAPPVIGVYEELEASRLRILAHCDQIIQGERDEN